MPFATIVRVAIAIVSALVIWPIAAAFIIVGWPMRTFGRLTGSEREWLEVPYTVGKTLTMFPYIAIVGIK